MDKGTAEADILCFSLDYTLRGQQKNRPAKISAVVLTFLVTSRHVCLPRSTVHKPLAKGKLLKNRQPQCPLLAYFSKLGNKNLESETFMRRLLLRNIIVDL